MKDDEVTITVNRKEPMALVDQIKKKRLNVVVGSRDASIIDIILYLILGVVMCFFSSCWGCSCGIKHLLLDWENEGEVFQQNVIVITYMLPNVFISIFLMIFVIIFGYVFNPVIITIILILLMSCVAVICFNRMMSLCK